MSDKEWTPADIGCSRIDLPNMGSGVYEGWRTELLLSDEEKRLVEAYLMRRRPGLLSANGWFFATEHQPWQSSDPIKASHDPLGHLAPDHPWRKGTVPRLPE